MKKIKNDTRYIIRKVIIGVLIAIILSSLHSCKVLAEERPVYNVQLNQFSAFTFPNQIGNLKEIITLPSNYSNNDYKYITATSRDIFNYSYSIFYNEDLNLYLYIIIPNQSYSYINSRKVKITIENNSTYYDYYNENIEEYTCVGGLSYSFVLSPNQISNFSSTVGFNYNYYAKNNNTNEYFYQVSYLGSNFNDNWSLFSSNTNYLEINNEIIYDHPDFPPQGFLELDISNYQGVIFVPKNYSNVQIESVDNINYIDFNFYYQGSIKNGYFPLNNPSDINILNLDFLNSPLVPQYIDSYFPMYENPTSQDDTGYQYYAYTIYNNILDNPIGTKVWYNSLLFDYYLVENFDTYEQDITFINRNNEEFTIPINTKNTWKKIFEFNSSETWDGNSYLDGKKDISSLFDIFKIPFNFLRGLSKDKCVPINIPIPFVSGNIQIDCLSSKFKDVLGNSFYNTILIIVNGLLAYRITLKNIDTATDVLNPNDDKLEVVDL